MSSVYKPTTTLQTEKADLSGWQAFLRHEDFPSPSHYDPKIPILKFVRFVLGAEPKQEIVQAVSAINSEATGAALEALLDLISKPICQSSRSVDTAVKRTMVLLAYSCVLHDRHAGQWEWF